MQCRSCMDANPAEVVEMASIVLDDGKTLYDLFNECTQLQATAMDKLPKILCTTCTRNLQIAYDFRKGALQADKQLRELVENPKIEAQLICHAIEQSEEVEYDVESLNDPLAGAGTKTINEPEILIAMGDIKEECTEEPNKQMNEELYEEQIDEETEEHLMEDEEQEEEENMSFDNKVNRICEICNANMCSRNALRDHIFDQHKSDIICMKCPKVYEFPRELKLHEVIVHGTEKELQCIKCKEFLKRDKLPRHFQVYHKNNYRKYFPTRRRGKAYVEGTAVSCDDCRQDFATILELADHLRNHKFDCALCARSFKKNATYKAHLKRIHKRSLRSLQDTLEFDTKYDCAECASKFVLHKTYRIHLKNEHKINISKSSAENDETNICECELCNNCFKSLTSLYEHKKQEHSAVEEQEQEEEEEVESEEKSDDSDFSDDWHKPFKCYICSRNFKTKLLYKHHMKKMHKENITIELKNHEGKLYECKICYSNFPTRSAAHYHKKRKHPEELRTKQTSPVEENSTTIGLEAQDAKEASDNSELVECSSCQKKLPANEMEKHKKRHLYRLKEKSKRFLCAFCPLDFRMKTSLKKHEKRMHLGVKPELKECPICQKKLASKYLRHHLSIVHATERKFVCDTCDVAFKSQILLSSHKLLHKKRDFHCSVCDKKFIRSHDLNLHLRKHTGEEPYTCHICDKRFKAKGTLNYHLQRHAGIKRKCDVCGKEFNHVKQLKLHSYKHTGMPYICPVCDYGCAQRDYFRKHLSRMHDMTLTNEEYCAMFKANTGRSPHVKSLEELQSEERKTELHDSN